MTYDFVLDILWEFLGKERRLPLFAAGLLGLFIFYALGQFGVLLARSHALHTAAGPLTIAQLSPRQSCLQWQHRISSANMIKTSITSPSSAIKWFQQAGKFGNVEAINALQSNRLLHQSPLPYSPQPPFKKAPHPHSKARHSRLRGNDGVMAAVTCG